MLTVRYKPTNEIGTIVDNEFDPSIYEQVSQPNPVNKLMPNTLNKSEMPNMSFGGLISNASQDIGGIAQGLTKLPGLAYKLTPAYPMVESIKGLSTGNVQSGRNAYIDQLKTMFGVGKGVVNEANELVGRPFEGGDFLGRAIGHAYNKPITTALDIYGGVKAVQGVKGLLTKKTPVQAISEVPPEAQVTPAQVAQIDLKTNVPQTNIATKSFLSPFTIPTKIGKYMKPQEVAKYMVDHGVSGSLDDLGGLADTVTGQTGKITELTNTLAGSATTPVEISADLLNKAQRAELLRVYGSKLPSIPVEGTTAMTAVDALSFQRQLEAIGHQYMRAGTNYLTPNVRYEQLGSSYLDASSEIGKALNKVTVDPSALSAIKTPQNVEYLNSLVPGLGDDLLSVKNLSGLRSLASPYVKLGQMVEQTLAASQSAFNKLAGNLSEAIPTLSNPLAPVKAGVDYLQNTPAVRTGAAGLISNIAKTGGKVATGAKTFGELLPPIGLAGSLNAPETQPTQTPAIINNLVTPAQATAPTIPSTGGVAPVSEAQTTLSGYTPEQLYAGMQNAQKAGNTDAATQLRQMYLDETNYQKTSGKGTQLNQNAVSAEAAWKDVTNKLFKDGDVLNGAIDRNAILESSTILGKIVGHPYESAMENLLLKFAQSQTPTGRLTPPMIDIYRNTYMPKFNDTDETVRTKIANMYSAIQNARYTKLMSNDETTQSLLDELQAAGE